MLGDFEDEIPVVVVDRRVRDVQCGEDLGQASPKAPSPSFFFLVLSMR